MPAHHTPFALFDDATWPDRPALLLSGGAELVEARRADEVPGALAAIEAGVARGQIAAGVCAYELGYVFEPRLLPLVPVTSTPLLRFHLFSEARRLSADERDRWLRARASGPALAGEFVAALGPERHRAKVARVRQLIGDGDVYQVNLTFKLRAQATGDPFATYAHLRANARSGACAFLRFSDEDILSFSPELFFRVRHGRIEARPMKGTTPRAPDVAGDERQRRELIEDEKQRAENLMIVDLLRNDLARVSRAGSVGVTDLFTAETYPRFHTLTSGVAAELEGDVSFSRVLRALFPCGSVTGAPKIRAMEIIREVEDEPRGAYCGAVGFVMRDRMAFNVAIRSLVLRDSTAELGVGGGIVWDSHARSEYEECLLKARFLTEPSEPFRLIETMRWTPGAGFHLLARHLRRLQTSSRYFGFVFEEVGVRRALRRAVAGKSDPQRVRLTLGPRGDVEVEATPLTTASDPLWRYALASTPVDSNDWRLHHKTTLRGLYERELAARHAESGCDEVVFCNERGEITEGSRTNVFLEGNGVWLTPPLSSGVLDGCLRRELLERGPQHVIEQVLRPEDLADGTVWFGNSLRGLIRGAALDSRGGAARDDVPKSRIAAAGLIG
jgi:para-aminobenzoate synthetase/4-amino-4-deoxychorismate lyase